MVYAMESREIKLVPTAYLYASFLIASESEEQLEEQTSQSSAPTPHRLATPLNISILDAASSLSLHFKEENSN